GVAQLSADQKQTLRQDSVEIFRDFPLFGTGAGTYAHVYPRYKTIPGDEVPVEHARNDLLELLVESGLVGVLLSAWFLLA
ncbi:MAG: hypothetical protein GWN58_19315, partial [Anaerolineae bacterium]|nr:hypothetical protein [Anaerolineae bacterium]